MRLMPKRSALSTVKAVSAIKYKNTTTVLGIQILKIQRETGKPPGTMTVTVEMMRAALEKKNSLTSRKTLLWLFSQAFSASDSQGHHAENNNGGVFDISGESLSKDNLEADPCGLNNDVPLFDPISEFFLLHELSKAGDDRCQKMSLLTSIGLQEHGRGHLHLLVVGSRLAPGTML